MYAEAQQWGVETVRRLVERHALRCGLIECPACVYTREEGRVADLRAEGDSARALGLPAELVTETELPFDVAAALRLDRQARFHPARYVVGLAATLPGDGSHVFEASPIDGWGSGRVWNARGSVAARCVIMATHLPPGRIGGLYRRVRPWARPLIAAHTADVPQGMYIGADAPTRSINPHRGGGDGDMALVACGAPFVPGHTEDGQAAMGALEDWLIRHFQVVEITHRWVSADYRPIDGLPFVGWTPADGNRYLVATGFDAWGISNGTAAGRVLCDLAAGETHPWAGLFDAARPAGEAPERDAGSAGRAAMPDAADALGPGEAAIVRHRGEDVALWRDPAGRLHGVVATCPHLGCLLGWNPADRTWDCPCHGARFDTGGAVLHGPAVTPLRRVETD